LEARHTNDTKTNEQRRGTAILQRTAGADQQAGTNDAGQGHHGEMAIFQAALHARVGVHGAAVAWHELGRVTVGPAVRRGITDLDGRGDAVGGIVVMRFGENALTTIQNVKARLEVLGGSRMTLDGVLVLFAQGSRSQEMNRQEARDRLIDLIKRATEKPKPRRPTKPTYSSKLKRLETKGKRAGIKTLRGKPRGDD